MTDTAKTTKLKIFLVEKRIKQRELSKKSNLSVTSLHNLINKGKSSDKTIKALTDCFVNEYGFDMTEDDVKNLLETVE